MMITYRYTTTFLILTVSALFFNCINDPDDPDKPDKPQKQWNCNITGEAPDFLTSYGCKADFDAMASVPLSEKIPGATSAKTVFDRDDPLQRLYFQNSKKFQVHYEFASTHLSGEDLPIVPSIGQFNTTEYYRTNRRFILGAVTYYEGPKVWAYEIAPYDNASADMILQAFDKIADSTCFGDSLYFHPTSTAVADEAKKLPSRIKIITTEQLYAGIDYQPLNVATSVGRLVFVKASALDTAYVSYRDIPVLDMVPNDISVTSGIITEAFQTPLAHINVLSQNRKTPNMALRGAWTNTQLRALENKWVKLSVELSGYTITEATTAEADAWWDLHKPTQVGVANMDTTVKELTDVGKILDIAGLGLGPAIKKAIPAFGGKTSHFSTFPYMDSTKVPYPKEAFGIPVYYYWQHMEKNGLNKIVAEMLANDSFKNYPSVRDKKLEKLREAIMDAPLDSAFESMLFEKLATKFSSGSQVRFRSSTNAEDLDGFTGAGLYTSDGGNMDKPKSIRKAIRTVWASVWFFRAFEEREYRQIDHKSVGMALLVHRSFSKEEATGVAITANIFDNSGVEPGFYVNVQYGDGSVVLPGANVTSDEFIYHFDMEGRPIVYTGHSNVLPQGMESVLTEDQIFTLGTALATIHNFFKPLYGSNSAKRFAMDTEFKFDQPLDNPDGVPVLEMKQCRPYYAD
ncbi:MAG TPA: PEP/pyruvate-binding domain-containing protein [Chitinispirillaceae bacterium]|nr:PEP/pyruvate-binding domain-containing protein [Chitinispirillaceae bacterium]